MDFLPRSLSPYSPLNPYPWKSFRQLEEAKRLTRRMGDCFSLETIDISTTHVIIPHDDPQLKLSLEFFLALIYGWFVRILSNELFEIVFLVVLSHSNG